jgi:hypothetical protein
MDDGLKRELEASACLDETSLLRGRAILGSPGTMRPGTYPLSRIFMRPHNL